VLSYLSEGMMRGIRYAIDYSSMAFFIHSFQIRKAEASGSSYTEK
jgi:hypothetical protein